MFSQLFHHLIRVILLSLFATAVVHAHKVNLFTYVEADTVFVEGYFSDGGKAQNSAVTVHAESGDLLLDGVTDSEGQFSFVLPQQRSIMVVLNAGMGHRAEQSLALVESEGEGESAELVPILQSATTAATDLQQLKPLIKQAVAEAIKPLVRELSEYKNHASMSEIIGGIGYIFGVLGLLAYFQARKEKGE